MTFFHKKSLHILFITTMLMVASCTKIAKIRALEPAEISDAAKLKRVAVLEFRNDTIGLSGKIETIISKKRFNGKPFFTLVNRKNIDQVLKEQKMSDILDESSTVELGKLLGTQALISGEVFNTGSDDQTHLTPKTQCAKYYKKKCVQWISYNIRCTKRTLNVSANIRIADIKKGSLIYTDSFSQSNTSDSCKGNLTPKQAGLNAMAQQIASRFVYKLTPNYVNFEVELLDSSEIKYSSEQEDMLENAIEFIEANNLDHAKNILEKLHQSTNGKSLVAAYNLGTVHEALGDYQEAKIYYQISSKLQKKPIKQVNKAVRRIDTAINRQKQVQQQLKGK